MKFKTINPATEDVIETYETMSNAEIFDIAKSAEKAFKEWREMSVSERAPYFRKMADVLRENKREYGEIITTEMGKPIREAIGEVEKCAWLAEFYAETAEGWLKDQFVEADGEKHIVAFQPLGVILSIMPWNFPFWQALRFGVPSIIAGNVSILKHSNVVPQCAFAIEDIFRKSGFPENIFRTILSDHDSVFDLMASEIIKGISFTGSTNAGKKVAQAAGNNLKKVVMELGGSDPFIVLEDSDIEVAAKNAIIGRTMNTGQSCIASKRFIVVKDVAEEFASQFAKRMENLTVGDPMSEETDVGCLVNKAALEEIEEQVQDAVDKGATILTGGERVGNTGFFYKPTVLTDVNFQMKVVTEEVFGPVAPIIVVDNEDEAIEIANRTKFGLGGSVWTKDMERGLRIARKIEAGSVFVNSITKSDPRMPFGGVKESGFGRELSEFGLKEFVNVKGLNVYRQ